MSKPAAPRRKNTPPAPDAAEAPVDVNTFKEIKMAALKKQWEDSNGTDRHALWEALNFGLIQLPPWLSTALKQLLKSPPQDPSGHGGRWLLIREGRAKGMSLAKAYEYAKEQAEAMGPPWAVNTLRAMRESYNIVQRERRGGKKQMAPFRS
jgi:hypothetical protein